MAQRVAALYAEIDAKTDKFDKGLKGVDDSLQGAQGKLSKLGGAFEELTGISLGAAAGVAGVAGAVKALADSAQAAANWGDAMGDLAQITGVTVEEASKMAGAFELVGVSSSTLESAIKGMTKEGLQPNFATMKKLAAEYQAIQSPVERNEFLFKKFGRAGLEMAEIMGRSAEELDRLAGAAVRSGKAIGTDAADAAEEFNLNMAILKQRAEGAQIAIGNALIPTLNSAATAFDQLVTIWQMGQVKLREQRGEIDGATAALEMQRIAGIEPATEATEDAITATESAAQAYDTFGMAAYGAATAAFSVAVKQQEAKRAADDLRDAQSDLADAIAGPVGKENENFIRQQADIRLKMQDVQGEIDNLNGKSYLTPAQQTELGELKTTLGDLQTEAEKNAQAHEEATARIVFGFVQQRLAADGLQDGEITMLSEIGKAWGIYDTDTANALAAVDTALGRHGATAQTIMSDIKSAVEGIPDYKAINIEVRTNNVSFGAEPGGAAPVNITPGKDTQVGNMRAAGGSFIVPPGYVGDTYSARFQSGERVDVTPAGQVQTAGGSDMLAQMIQALPGTIARAVRDGVQMAMA